MAYVEQLRKSEVKEFARNLAALVNEPDFMVHVSREDENKGWFISIEYKWNHELDIRLQIKDYREEIWQYGLLDGEVIHKENVKHLYNIFGNSYRKDYLRECAKIFEE